MKPLTACVRTAPNALAATATPIVQTATFAQPGALEPGPFDYSRSGNPTRAVLEEQLARLDGALASFATGSGMAAIDLVLRGVEGHVLAGADGYGGTHRLLGTRDVDFVDFSDLAAVRAALRPDTGLLLVESPTNPLQHVADLGALAELARAHGALLAVDNSLMGPLLQCPIELGADLVVHSATKFLGGHGDLTAGVVSTGRQDLAEQLAWWQNATGCALAPFPAFLLLRGLKTLGVRQRAQGETARRIEELLRRHPAVRTVHAPTGPIHARQARGAGSVLSFETGSVERSRRVIDGLRLASICVSFGSVATTVSLPCAMSHASIPVEERRLAPDLVRLSVGLEDPADLLADLARALERVARCAG